MWPSAAAHISAVVFWNLSAVFTSTPRASSWRTAGTLPARAAASSGVSPSGCGARRTGARLQQQVHHRGVAAAARVEQRGDAELVGGIDRGPGGDERAGDVEVGAVGGPEQRRGPVAGRGVDVGAGLEESADDLEVSGFHRLDERAIAAGASHGHEYLRRPEARPRMRARREPSESLLRRGAVSPESGRLEAPFSAVRKNIRSGEKRFFRWRNRARVRGVRGRAVFVPPSQSHPFYLSHLSYRTASDTAHLAPGMATPAIS